MKTCIELLHRGFANVTKKTKLRAGITSIDVLDELFGERECNTPKTPYPTQPASNRQLKVHSVSNASRRKPLASSRLPCSINTSPFSATSILQLKQAIMPPFSCYPPQLLPPRNYRSPISSGSTSERRDMSSSTHSPPVKSQPDLLDRID